MLRAFIALKTIACIAFKVTGVNDTYTPLRNSTQHVFHIHISKVGLSFENEVSRNIKQNAYGEAFNRKELFLTPLETGISPEENELYFSSLMLRNPRTHVVSLFNHCLLFKGRTFLRLRLPHFKRPTQAFYDVVEEGGIKSWLEHFVGSTNASQLDDLGCYEPINFQSRFVVTTVDKEGSASFYPPTTIIDRALQAIDFVGLLEYYRESHCLFGYQVTGTLPQNCADPCSRLTQASKNLHVHHGYKNTIGVDELDGQTLQLIDRLTTVDTHLYAAALRRFRHSARVAGISLEPCMRQKHGRIAPA